MESEMISRQFNDLFKNFTNNLGGFETFQEQWGKMLGMFSGKPFRIPEMDDTLMDNCLKIWQDAARNLFQFFPAGGHLADTRGMLNQFTDEIWRTLRLANVEQVERVTKSIGVLESQVSAMQAKDYTEEVQSALAEDTSLIRKNDLRSLKASITNLKKGMVGPDEVLSMRESVDHLETELENHKKTLANIKELVAGIESKLGTLSSSAQSKPSAPPATVKTSKSTNQKKSK